MEDCGHWPTHDYPDRLAALVNRPPVTHYRQRTSVSGAPGASRGRLVPPLSQVGQSACSVAGCHRAPVNGAMPWSSGSTRLADVNSGRPDDDPVPPRIILRLDEAFRVLEALEDARLGLRDVAAAPGLQDELATVIRLLHGRLGLDQGGVS